VRFHDFFFKKMLKAPAFYLEKQNIPKIYILFRQQSLNRPREFQQMAFAVSIFSEGCDESRPLSWLACVSAYCPFIQEPYKGPFKYYVITFFNFLGPPTSLMIYSTLNHQKLPFSDSTHPPLS
jgi:hypothetical protein